MKRIHWLIYSLMILSLSACGISLASDITPPPNYQPPMNQEPVVQTTVSPLVPPSLQNGKEIYVGKCVDCHGLSGKGDGNQADQLPVAVAPIGDPDFAKYARPSDWYQIITVGNLENFMPGFSSLSDRERWDVTAYALSLSITKQDLELGKQVFSEYCADCHQVNNDESVVDFTSPEDLSDLSLEEIMTIIQKGNGSTMNGFEDALSEEEIWSSAVMIRSLSFDDSGELLMADNNSESNSTDEDEQDTEVSIDQFSVKGSLGNLETISPEQTVLLVGYDGMEQAIQVEASVNEDGGYEFLDLEYVDGRVYQILAMINNVQHSSEVFHNPVVDDNGFVNIPVKVMASTTDTSKVYAERMHIFFEFVDPDMLQVVELLIVQNPSDLVIVPEDPNTPIINYQLPEGATNLQFEQGAIGDRYILTDTGFGDLQPIEPNIPKQFLYAYNLPYENKMTLELDLPMDVEASIVMLPAGVGVEIESDQLSFTREQSMQGTAIRTYSTGRLPKGENLKLGFRGKYKPSVDIGGMETSDTTGIIVGSLVLLAAIGFGVVFLRRQKTTIPSDDQIEEPITNDENEINDLLDAVIALDEAHAKDELPEDAYHHRRQELTQRIARLQGEK